MDGDKKITFACELVVIAERLELYKFNVEGLLTLNSERVVLAVCYVSTVRVRRKTGTV